MEKSRPKSPNTIPAPSPDLSVLRGKIDGIDDKMLELLAERTGYVRQVGELKSEQKSQGRSIIRPGREADMVRRVAETTGTGLSSSALALMWRLIISSAMNIEEEAHFSAFSPPANREAYWLAREYFGAFTQSTERPTAAEVLRDVLERRVTVGVVPLKDEDLNKPWWSRMATEENAPKIFARLPFIQLAPSKKPLLACLGYVEPEPSQDDESLFVLEAQETIIFSLLEPLLRTINPKFEKYEQCRVVGVTTYTHHLLRFPGFIHENSDAIKGFLETANAQFATGGRPPVRLCWLGSYASPITYHA